MRIKNLSPFLVGFKATSLTPPQPQLMVVVRGRFALRHGQTVDVPGGHSLLAQGTMTGDVFAERDDERLGECLYPSDFAEFKPHAEVMVCGSCYAPGGAAVKGCDAEIAVGGWSKRIWVVGDRHWQRGPGGEIPSEPEPFTQMPLDYAHSFGGAGYAHNPVGKGHGGKDLPNIEVAGHLIRSRTDQPEPVNLGPVSPFWPLRRNKLGKNYGPAYRDKRAPYFPDDFDWTHFNAAPLDQQLDGYLRGDEALSLRNLNPSTEIMRTTLPGLRMRAFISAATDSCREIPLHLDTLLVHTDEQTVTLSWRGVTNVTRDDVSDVRAIMVASEPLAERARKTDDYRAMLEAFELDPVGDAAPDEMKDAWQALNNRNGDEPAAAGIDGGADDAAPADPLSRLVAQQLGGFAEPEQAQLRHAMAGVSKRTLPGGTPLGDALAKAVRGRRNDPMAIPTALKSTTAPQLRSAQVGIALRTLLGHAQRLRKQADARGDSSVDIARLDALLNDPRLAALDPASAASGERVEPVVPGPGADLSGRDLSEHDLSGQDLRGANLSGAILTRANLAGARLAEANLASAVLFEADLSDADLSGADLSHANATRVTAARTRFDRSTLDGAVFEAADLADAVLDGASAQRAMFTAARLPKASCKHVRFDEVFFERADLWQANFSDAQLSGCSFSGAKARQSVWRGASVTACSFSEAELLRASFEGCSGERSVWLRARLDEVDFGFAVLPYALLVEIRAKGASFFGADLRHAQLSHAILEDVAFAEANLFAADLRSAALSHVDFRKTNLYRGVLLGALMKDCNFRGANLKRCTPEPT